jgi:tRNA threonylcarbamoyladenosine biosynthesis protein TsaE
MGPFRIPDEAAMKGLGGQLAAKWNAGDVVLLNGPLGAGKTTFVRGVLRAFNFDGPVRSPTYNLLQTFPTQPPVLHADLYRLQNAAGIGLEDYLDDYLCLIEWPERLGELISSEDVWSVYIDFAESDENRRAIEEPQLGQSSGRLVTVKSPPKTEWP